MCQWLYYNSEDFCVDFLLFSVLDGRNPVIFLFAEKSDLSENNLSRSLWSLVAPRGNITVAHCAALHNNLPKGFKYWDICDQSGWTVAHRAALSGYLPVDFSGWRLADKDGVSVAHVAMRHKNLVKLFIELCNDWRIATKFGWTVAHAGARAGTLPKDFNMWHLATLDGWSVAHEAAANHTLPKDFSDWALSTQRGWTVAHAAAASGILPDDVPSDYLQLKNSEGITVSTVLAKRYGIDALA